MTIDQISGNASGIPPARKAVGVGNASFDRVLSESVADRTASVALPSEGATGTVCTKDLVKIGTITSKNPTVSNLLIRNSALKKDCWNIIYAEQNQDKAYTRIPTGTDIFYDPATKELLWGDKVTNDTGQNTMATTAGTMDRSETQGQGIAPLPAPAETETGTGSLSETLVNTVRSLIGKSYSDLNCYELVVAGLNNMGVRYSGGEGLASKMVSGALQKGLPMNAYLNGEGLIRFSGSETYRKTFMQVSDPEGQAKQVIAEIAQHLEKGSILSFSTESRGHTGIVSSKDGNWTFINSGVMDHSVDDTVTRKGVGEENLTQEIENWFKLAAGKNESLVITLGTLNSSKLAAYGAGRELAVS
jgi:hypothetical protein